MASHSSQDIYAETLAVFDRSDHQYEPLTTPEVADALDLNRRTVYKRLRKLVDRGELETKETGSNSRVWWRPPARSSAPAGPGNDDEATAGSGSTSTDGPIRKPGQTERDREQSASNHKMGVNYHEIFETLPDGVSLHDPTDGTLVDVNQQLCDMLGYTREELSRLDFEALHADVPPFTSDRAREYIQQAATDGPQTFEWLDVTKGGEHLPVEVHLRRTTIDDEDRILAVVRDITDRKEREQELRQLKEEYETVFTTAQDAIFLVDVDKSDPEYEFTIRRTNPAHEAISGLAMDSVSGNTPREILGEEAGAEVAANHRRCVDTEEPITYEEALEFPAGTVHFRTKLSPVVRDGEVTQLVGVGRDINDRKERERELKETNRQLQAVLDTVEASIFIKDTEGRYQLLNEECRKMLGLDPDEEVIGMTDDDLFPADTAEQYRADDRRVLERGETIEIEDEVPTPQGTQTNLTLKSPLFDANGEPAGVCGVSADITDRKERERELQARSAAMEASIDGMAILDSNGKYVFVNQAHADIYGYDDRDAFLGESWRLCYDGDELARFEDEVMPTLTEEGAWRGEAIGQREDGSTFPQELSLTLTDDGGIVCVVRDITDRKERERELRAARQFNEELVENAPFGMFRLDEDLRFTYENPRAEEIIGLPEDEDESMAIGMDIRELPSIVETGQAALFTRLRHGETIEFEFPFESIYGREAYFTGRGVPLYRNGEFDGAVLMVTDISERRQRERELERQREQLAALDELNNVVRGITEAAIEQSTRNEIENVVCDRLADSDSYRFAWICAVDSNKQLEPRAEGGIEGYLDEITLSTDSDHPTGQCPAGKAVRTQEIQVRQNVLDDPDLEPWHQYAHKYAYRSSVAIPIVHRGTLYGVLGIHSERPDAFVTEEREVVGQLGEVIGHAIAALDRKRALMSDEVVELKIRIPELLESNGISVTADGTITIERSIPIGDDEFLMYGTATGDDMEVIYAMGEQFPDWKSVRTFDETDDEVRFEQHLSNPPMTSTVADNGGHFEVGRIRDGEYSATIHLPPGTDARRVVAAIRETYPSVEAISQRQVTREKPSPRKVPSALTEDLTERQRAALETGYYGGFFEWPRERSGEEVAESLDIGPSTFHQHVRKAEKKLLDVVFEA